MTSLQKAREAVGLTIDDVCDHCPGLSPDALALYETEMLRVPLDDLFRLTVLYGAPLWLIDELQAQLKSRRVRLLSRADHPLED